RRRSPSCPLFPYTTLFRSTQLGANNYSLGAPVAGVKYAREVNAMQSAGALRAGTISKANARCWAGLCRNVLQAGARFDKRNFSRSEEHTSELQSLRHLVCR